MLDALARLKSEISELKRNRRGGRTRPHKLLMLLAVLDLADDGLLARNQLFYDEDIIRRFERHFRTYRRADDLCQPAPPFFHLRSSPFWRHKVKEGQDQYYGRLTTSGGGSQRILDTIEYAYLTDYAFDVIACDTTRIELRQFIQNMLENEA